MPGQRPAKDLLGHRIDRTRGGAGAEPQPLKGSRLVNVLVDHQGTLGLLDQHPGGKGDLELGPASQTLDLRLGGRAKQAGHHPGVGLEGADLALVPVPGSAA